jgi:SAM-dependent methyltransferase
MAPRTAPAAPSPWIERFAPRIAGPALDLACGSGRHVRWLLARGLAVTAVDRDVSGLADIAGAPGLETIAADLESEAAAGGWPLDERRFATVIVANYLWRPLLPAIVAAVAESGTLLYETFAHGNAAFGQPANPAFLLAPGELLDAVRGKLQVVAYEHGVVDAPRPAVMQRICAVRGNGPVPL